MKVRVVIAIGLTLLSTVPVLAQQTVDPRCGSYSLYSCLRALDVEVGDFAAIDQLLGKPGPKGYSIADLQKAAVASGAHALAVQTNAERLTWRRERFCCIARVDGNHFLNIYDIENGNAHLIDPPKTLVIPVDTLGQRWDGFALLVATEPLVAEEDLSDPKRFRRIVVFVLTGSVGLCVIYFGLRRWSNRKRKSVS